MEYILLTPIKNEETYLPMLAGMLARQTTPPALWLLVNDASSDNSQAIIDQLCEDHPWVCSVTLPFEHGGLGLHYARVVAIGFEALQKEALSRQINYDLLGKVDADVIFEADCFAALSSEFSCDPRLGIASPSLTNGEPGQNGVKKEVVLSDHPTDGIRLFRKDCFDQIGGSPLTRAPETVAEARAAMCGWTLRRFDQIEAWHRRKTHSSTSLWARWEMAGSEQHYLGYHPLLVLGHVLYELVFRSPKYLFLAHLYGYLKAVWRREAHIEDDEILAYFRRQRLKEVLGQLPALWKRAWRR